MTSSVRNVLSVLVLASLAAAAPGCSHDTLGSGTQDLNVVYTPSPAGSGRYESASLALRKLTVVPTDPATGAILGSEALLFRFDPFSVVLTQTSPVTFTRIALAAGTYRVKFIEFTPPALQDDNLPPNPATCIEGIDILNNSSAPGVPSTFGFDDPASLTFTIQPGQTKLSLTVNVPGLIAGYESSFTCVPGNPPSLTGFNAANFRAVLLANVTLE